MHSSLETLTITAVCLEHMVGESGTESLRTLKTMLKSVGGRGGGKKKTWPMSREPEVPKILKPEGSGLGAGVKRLPFHQ